MDILSHQQIDHFVHQGFTTLGGGFARAIGDHAVSWAMKESAIDLQAPRSWPDNRRWVIRQSLADEHTAEMANARIRGALDQLLGKGRYEPPRGTGYLLVNLPTFAGGTWQPVLNSGHIDGTHFHHHVNSREQGLIMLYLFTDVAAGGGGTWVRPGSHLTTARILADAQPHGLAAGTTSRRAKEASADIPAVEVTANAGDVILMHPMLYHGSSTNVSSRPRVASNLCVILREPMQLDRDDPADHSPVERAIRIGMATATA